jgi:hypothetical protein
MPGFNTLPAVGGGGGQANMTFKASVHMETYNRTWAQGGTPGYYAMYSTNQENGYVYFVGATTTGGPLNRLIKVDHAFTSINIIAPTNDMISLYKAKVKSTTVFNNPLDAFASFPSVISTSGNFVLPNNALPLVNVLLCGGGGSSGQGHTSHGGGGGGAGGGVVKLTAYQAVGTTAIVIGSGGDSSPGHNGGRTYFGNVYALGGGYATLSHNGDTANYYKGSDVANFGGNAGYQGGSHTQVTPTPQTASTGLGTSGSPVFHGGYHGGRGPGGSDGHNRGGGGGGAGGNGVNGGNNSAGDGGLGHISDISGSNLSYGPGGQGHGAHGGGGTSGWDRSSLSPVGHGAHASGGTNNNGSGCGNGRVVVRYYIP